MKFVTPTLMGALILYALVIAAGHAFRSQTPFFPCQKAADQDDGASDEERARRGLLEARIAAAVHRATVKEQVAAALIARSIPLTEAAARFRALDRTLPNAANSDGGADIPPSADSDGERYCRIVIKYIRHYFEEAATTPAVVARLEGELKTLLQDGAIQLPELNEE